MNDEDFDFEDIEDVDFEDVEDVDDEDFEDFDFEDLDDEVPSISLLFVLMTFLNVLL